MDPKGLKEWRRIHGLTLDQMSKDTGIHLVTICKWETGKAKPNRIYEKTLQSYMNRKENELAEKEGKRE